MVDGRPQALPETPLGATVPLPEHSLQRLPRLDGAEATCGGLFLFGGRPQFPCIADAPAAIPVGVPQFQN
jgi:hypothetical protein